MERALDRTVFEQRIEQGNEFGGEGKLAVSGMPAGGEDKQTAGPPCRSSAFTRRYGHFDQRGIALVEAREHAGIGNLLRVEAAMFPEMDFGEIAESGIGKGLEEGMRKVDVAEERVFLVCGLFAGD